MVEIEGTALLTMSFRALASDGGVGGDARVERISPKPAHYLLVLIWLTCRSRDRLPSRASSHIYI
jgi:hypothetical protein